MKIRTILLISYFLLILLVIVFSSFLRNIVIKTISKDTLISSENLINQVFQSERKFTDEMLITYAEESVEKRVQMVAIQVLEHISEKNEYTTEKIKKDKQLRKIATQDIISINGSPAGYIHLYDDMGFSIFHPIKEVEGENFFKLRTRFPKLWSLIRKSFNSQITSGYYEFIDKNSKVKQKFMVCTRIPNTHFILAASVYIDEFFLPIKSILSNINRKILSELKQHMIHIANKTSINLKYAGLIGTSLLLFLGILYSLWLSNSISKPISNLCTMAKNLGSGNFSTKIPENGPREISELAHSFNELGEKLNLYMENLKKEVSARQAYDCEMKISREIQEALIPTVFPNHRMFDLYAILHPAKEVSGDFFDFFFIDNDTLVVIIADVSGKSIPAALFMALTLHPLKHFCSESINNPAHALREVNKFSHEKNETCMFITVFLAYYNIRTGKILYANAGHEEMIHLKSDGKISMFGCFNDSPLGVKPDHIYKSGEITLQKGDRLVLFTDGVTDAESPEGDFFGIDRFRALLLQNTSLPVKELCTRINDTLTNYQGSHQFDDITLLMLERKK